MNAERHQGFAIASQTANVVISLAVTSAYAGKASDTTLKPDFARVSHFYAVLLFKSKYLLRMRDSFLNCIKF